MTDGYEPVDWFLHYLIRIVGVVSLAVFVWATFQLFG